MSNSTDTTVSRDPDGRFAGTQDADNQPTNAQPSGAQPTNTRPRIDPRIMPIDSSGPILPAVTEDRLSPQALRQRFSSQPDWLPELTGDRMRTVTVEPRAAAVLVPIIAHADGATVLLTERTAHLNAHAGQVAFPGGRCDPEDRDATATALREAQEEIGLHPERVDVIGLMPQYMTGTGYLVTPVVGIIEPGFDLEPHDFEVATIFEVPLRFLMDPVHHQRRRMTGENSGRIFYAMPWHCKQHQREFFIWGATAAMLRNLYRLLSV